MNTATNSEARLESILAQVRVLKAKYDERAEVTGENFNFFSFLNMERDEVKHSAIIAELLNPNGSHSQGKLFLKLFLEQLESIIDVSNEHTFIVRTEEYVPEYAPKEQEKGFLDIVIESDDAYIVIENKIDTVDAEGQLQKYCKYMEEEIKKDKKVLLYLTPEGKKPNNFNVCGKGPIHQLGKFRFPLMRLSYKDFIVKWLGNCIEKVTHISRIEETLHQYRTAVKELTWNETGEQRIVREVLSQGDNLEIIKEAIEGKIDEDSVEMQIIIKNMSSLRASLECEFWRALREQLKKQLQERLSLQLQDKELEFQLYQSDGSTKVIEDGKLDERVKEYIKRGYGGSSPGLTFRMPGSSLDKDHEVVCRITYDTAPISHLYYAFVLCKKEKDNIRERVSINNGDENHKKYLDLYLDLLEGEELNYDPEKENIWHVANKDRKHGWLGWKERADENIYFANGPALFDTLVKIKEGKVVSKLVEEICYVVNKISKKSKKKTEQIDP